MKVLIADQQQVADLLPMAEAIEVMRGALTMLADGDALLPLHSMLALPGGDGVLGLMPSYLGGLQAVGVKVIAAFPGNFGTGYDTHQGVVLVFDTERGLLRAIVDATSITALRTAAVSAVATDLLARPEAACSACRPAAPPSSRGARSAFPTRPSRWQRAPQRPFATPT